MATEENENAEFLDIEGLSGSDIFTIAVHAMQQLKWKLVYGSEQHVIAHTPDGRHQIQLKIPEDLEELSFESGTILPDTSDDEAEHRLNAIILGRFTQTFNVLHHTLTPADLLRIYAELAPLREKSQQSLKEMEKPTTWLEDMRGLGQLFVPSGDYIVTPIVIDICLLVFVAMVLNGVAIFEPSTADLLRWGGNARSVTLEGEPWRWLSCCFLHIGIFHLAMNVIALFFIGVLLEPLLGSRRFALAYFSTGVLSSAASLWWHTNSVSAGASGAIFGLYGVFLAILTTKLIAKQDRNALLGSILFFIGYNLLAGLSGEVDNAAHIGGLLSGIVVGYILAFGWFLDLTPLRETLVTAAVVVLTAVCGFWAYTNISKDWTVYFKQMDRFTENETVIMGIYNKEKAMGSDSFLYQIKTEIIPKWRENIDITQKIATLDLDENTSARNKVVQNYANLRLDYDNLFYSINSGASDDDSTARPRLHQIDSAIGTALENLKAEK